MLLRKFRNLYPQTSQQFLKGKNLLMGAMLSGVTLATPATATPLTPPNPEAETQTTQTPVWVAGNLLNPQVSTPKLSKKAADLPPETFTPQIVQALPEIATPVNLPTNASALLPVFSPQAIPGDRIAPSPMPDQLAQAPSFSDVQNHWAQPFIEALAARDIIRGFPDGTFRPDLPVTRAQFAAIVNQAFPQAPVRSPIQFADVPVSHWAYNAIQQAYQIGFLQGYPNNIFSPEQNIPRAQVLVSLTNGLNFSPTTDTSTVLTSYFQDANQIPNYARPSIATATENQLVVNYPNLQQLRPNQNATRAETAAFIYQAMARTGQVPVLAVSDSASQYIVGYKPPLTPTPPPSSGADDTLRQQLRLPIPPAALMLPSLGAVASPGSSSGTPTAFGADFGQAFVGASFQARTRYTNASDGALSAGFGLGDARKAVGVEVAVAILDLYRQGFASRGSVSFKVHRLLPDDFAVAVGLENALVWGGTDSATSLYGVVSKVFRLQEDTAKPFSTLTMSLGLGTGRFKSETDFNNGTGSVNVFGSVGLRVAEPVSLIADWTGQDLTVGASIVPFRNIPLVITPALADITGNAGDGARFILGVGYSFPFSF